MKWGISASRNTVAFFLHLKRTLVGKQSAASRGRPRPRLLSVSHRQSPVLAWSAPHWKSALGGTVDATPGSGQRGPCTGVFWVRPLRFAPLSCQTLLPNVRSNVRLLRISGQGKRSIKLSVGLFCIQGWSESTGCLSSKLALITTSV